VGLWKHIRRGWDTFTKSVRFEVGLGSKFSFGMIRGVIISH
jgi:hypothetical protein